MWLIKGAGYLKRANGVLRGPRIGTTVQGTLSRSMTMREGLPLSGKSGFLRIKQSSVARWSM
ncbi:hypothetical protein [Mesorhizobium sp.]|uniref:hypothetical protein n=1 Tax=Mesorhizobium sp. TaxID=1871066 RepID=UPI000FE53D90|nr:hypothetical protein [Mesorhizobium sp.]RWO58625.1 MAG: hypothetical protein EOS14_18090 [Mesorhizobium sp.]